MPTVKSLRNRYGKEARVRGLRLSDNRIKELRRESKTSGVSFKSVFRPYAEKREIDAIRRFVKRAGLVGIQVTRSQARQIRRRYIEKEVPLKVYIEKKVPLKVYIEKKVKAAPPLEAPPAPGTLQTKIAINYLSLTGDAIPQWTKENPEAALNIAAPSSKYFFVGKVSLWDHSGLRHELKKQDPSGYWVFAPLFQVTRTLNIKTKQLLSVTVSVLDPKNVAPILPDKEEEEE